MRSVPHRPLAAGLFVMTAMLFAVLAAGPSTTEAEGGNTVAYTIDTPPEVMEAVQTMRDRQGASSATHASPAQDEVIVVEETFDDQAFPPAGWMLGIPGASDTPEYQWSRETCDLEASLPGNEGAAWSNGGGTGGASLPCGSNYTAPVTAFLLYGPFDGTSFTRGLRLEWLSKHRVPGGRESFPYGFCVILGADESRCIVPSDPETAGWASYVSDPIAQAAGIGELYVYMLYRDETPTGTDFGAFVDEIAVWGLSGEAPPTWTPAPRTPSAPEGVHLPLAMKKAEKSHFPDIQPAQPGSAVAFGTDLDGVPNGDVVLDAKLIGSGTVFQYGHMIVCTRVTWWGQQVGSTLSWQWHFNGTAVAPGNTQINPSFQVVTENGSAGNCLANQTPEGDPAPIPLGVFMVNSLLNGNPSATNSATFQVDPPPGATPLPTARPTIAPSPTPAETPVGPCREFLRNGDMELGPTVWGYGEDPQTGRNIASVILDGISATSGTWAARLGGVLVSGGRHIEEIRQDSSPVGLIDPTRMMSATLRFNAGLLTNEVPGGAETDILLGAFVSDDESVEADVIGYISEDTIQSYGTYYRFEIDVTEEMTARQGWANSLLILQQQQNDQAGSNWYVDDVSLDVCRTESAGGTLRHVGGPAGAAISGNVVQKSAPATAGGSAESLNWRSAPQWVAEPLGAPVPGARTATSPHVNLYAAPMR